MEQTDNRMTLLVNSCDAYEDIWNPFFILLSKYYGSRINSMTIVLNTESIDYSFNNLNIQCVHPLKRGIAYGERMIYALKQIKTEYVLLLLDDFFLRRPVNHNIIDEIIHWMDEDKSIAYFNSECTPSYCELEKEQYPGFKRLPVGNEYILNMQAAIWRTSTLQKLWKPQVSPWEWEQICNLTAAESKRYKFYCAKESGMEFCYYGRGNFGISKGKWRSRKDVMPLFSNENIVVDFSLRGFLEDNTACSNAERDFFTEDGNKLQRYKKMVIEQFSIVCRCIPQHLLRYACYFVIHTLKNNRKTSVSAYIDYKLHQLRKRNLTVIQSEK